MERIAAPFLSNSACIVSCSRSNLIKLQATASYAKNVCRIPADTRKVRSCARWHADIWYLWSDLERIVLCDVFVVGITRAGRRELWTTGLETTFAQR
ncbi:hypothetical protein A1Q1_03429 [Trichosporon asahii var. asahii CBS 2479]|uniref:Uncharacterized protein n=1 Tax=Trichosporon asahii var. asahii (strain ATCC 90039 / CBS 2479 / JCM 2466 / KCTC 7840 / NBRC 103889/ NCYC 2677 / UAMH 7654) TaxID=1186058 RepID=J6EXU4_TRIAS|nr:hypothetical protein A1Q1_03429 [Trichosporon asahii var. asahii CBS 2479]EJT47652.1 hypothetical protein A1Q1_03429 [Trichosporon asahii var. asahii CBS 2479]